MVSMSSFSAPYVNSISPLGRDRGVLHWTPAMVRMSSSLCEDTNELCIAPTMGNYNHRDDQDDRDCDCDCTVDTSTLSSIATSTSTAATATATVTATENSLESLATAVVVENIAMKDSKNIKTNMRSQRSRNRHSKRDSHRHSNLARDCRVRFAPGTIPESTIKRKIKKRKQNDQSSSSPSAFDCDSELWWTKKELKVIKESCIFDIKSREFMSFLSTVLASSSLSSSSANGNTVTRYAMLDRFSKRNRKRRKLVRSKMYETAKAVQQYERATETKTPPEVLSKLLRLYSKPMEMDAIESALEMSVMDLSSDPIPTPSMYENRTRLGASIATRTIAGRNTRPTLLSGEANVALACARLYLERSLGTSSKNPSLSLSPILSPQQRQQKQQRAPAQQQEQRERLC